MEFSQTSNRFRPLRAVAFVETVARESVLDSNHRSANHLLASLPSADFEFLRPNLRSVELVSEFMLARAGDEISRVYFPESGVISLVVSLPEGETIEVAMIGRDGIFGARRYTKAGFL
jgi:CRP-like cAMP-binding protein